jgi:L-amino acid N-acyltransferase YncA
MTADEDILMIRNVRLGDAEVICRIYNHYIRNTVITFEEQPLTVAEMAARIEEYTTCLPWLVYVNNDVVLGYAYAGTWKTRSAYRYSVESSVYLDSSALGRGLGTLLYEALLAQLRAKSIHAVIAGITLPNQASVLLHEKFDFEKVACFKEVGRKFGSWLDVGYWQLLLQPPID